MSSSNLCIAPYLFYLANTFLQYKTMTTRNTTSKLVQIMCLRRASKDIWEKGIKRTLFKAKHNVIEVHAIIAYIIFFTRTNVVKDKHLWIGQNNFMQAVIKYCTGNYSFPSFLAGIQSPSYDGYKHSVFVVCGCMYHIKLVLVAYKEQEDASFFDDVATLPTTTLGTARPRRHRSQ